MSLSSGILRCGRHAAQEARAMAGGARRAASCRDQIVAGPVSISPPTGSARYSPSNGGTPKFAAIYAVVRHHTTSATSSRPPRIGSIVVSRTAMSMRTLGARDFHAAMRPRLLAWRRCSTWATSVTACFCPSWCTVSMIRDTPAWTGHDGPRDRGISAQRLHGYSSGRRSHRQYWMPTRYARAG